MKQLLSLALALLPCLAWAQYPSNGNQKITLGEQTTADGLIWRGVAGDTTKTVKTDTSAWIVLDTASSIMYHYDSSSVGRKWLRLNLLPSDTASMLTPYIERGDTASMLTNYWRSGRFSGTLGLLNGGTGSTTKNFVDLTTTQSISGNKTFISNETVITNTTAPALLKIDAPPNYTSSFQLLLDGSSYGIFGIASGNNDFITGSTNGDFCIRTRANEKALFSVDAGSNITFALYDNKVGIATASPSEKLHVAGNARITGAYDVTTGSAANVFVTSDGVLQRSTSSIKYKMDVEDYNKGINEVMKLRPITYKSINSNNDKIYAGFIAEELADLKLTELYENNDNGEPDAISYSYMVTLLTKAIQQQQSQIDELKKRIINLEKK